MCGCLKLLKLHSLPSRNEALTVWMPSSLLSKRETEASGLQGARDGQGHPVSQCQGSEQNRGTSFSEVSCTGLPLKNGEVMVWGVVRKQDGFRENGAQRSEGSFAASVLQVL